MAHHQQQGPWVLKERITGYLRADMPSRIKFYREFWKVDDRLLPMPGHYHSYEPPSLDVWPTIITVQLSTNSLERTDYHDGLNPEYRVSYAMRTYVWVKNESPEDATEARDRLTTVVRSSLLDRQSFDLGPSHPQNPIILDETSVREEFSDVTYVKGDRVVCGAYISYTAIVDEAIVRPEIATVQNITMDMHGSGDRQADLTDLPQVTQITLP